MSPSPGAEARPIAGQIRPNQGERDFSPTMLITGFGPFPGVRINPSEALARKVASDRRWARLGWQVRQRAFLTGYTHVAAAIREEAARTPPPAFVVMLGVAAKRKAISIELLAKNRVSITHRDASKARPAGNRLEQSREVIRRGRHPGEVLVKAFRAAQVPAQLSQDTGRYVCNAAYWQMLGAMPRDVAVVFVHIPMPGRAGARKYDPRPDLDAMARGLTRAIFSMMRRARW